MNILLIYAYPNNYGFNHEIKETVKKNLDTSHELRIIDLYKEAFNPVLFFDEQKKRRFLYLDKETDLYKADILWADLIVFIFPI